MKRCKYIPALLALLLLLSACGGPFGLADPRVQNEASRLAAAQLGKLDPYVTGEERRQVTQLLERMLSLRQVREDAGIWTVSDGEEQLAVQLNQLYEDFTRRSLGEPESWSADEEKMELLAEYDVKGGGLEFSEGEDSYRNLWEQVKAMLPQGSLDAFDRFTVFTDGEEEILAYVVPTDDEGSRWELAVDPKDAGDETYFAETVFHEYCHYLTLNDQQVAYETAPSQGRYTEEGMITRPGSYLNAFYQEFWTDYLSDRLADPESTGFYLRHSDDFLTGYAATSPSEDIAESFAFFIMGDKAEGESIQARKQNFFYAYPELVTFRDQARAKLGL